tara:strand:+ start:1238 stop:1612 length:375 start_codon:yes stop_codon:yes gene_type:complete
MALNWDLSKIKDKDFYENCYIKMGKEGKENYQLSPQTNHLIWLTMTVGINKITESNWKDFYVRVIHAQRARGNENYGITAQDVYNHIGLCTNAQTKTKRQFLDTIYNVLEINVKKYEISEVKHT